MVLSRPHRLARRPCDAAARHARLPIPAAGRLLAAAAVAAALIGSPSLAPAQSAQPQQGAPAQAPGADRALASAKQLAREGRYGEAADLLASVIEATAEADPDLLRLYGELLVAAERFAEAVPVLERARAARPNAPRIAYQLATAYAAVGRTDEALEAFAHEIEVNRDPAVRRMALVNRGLLFRRLERWAEAAATLEQALALAVDSPEAFGELARLYLEAGQPERAADALERGEQQGFRSAALYFNAGAHFFNDGAHERAAAMFEKALSLDPRLAEAERGLGWALAKLGRRDEARRHLRRYLELRPTAADRKQIEAQLERLQRG